MSERAQGLLLIVLVLLAAFVLSKVVGPSSSLVLLFALLAVNAARVSYRNRQSRKELTRIIHFLQSRDAAEREELLERIGSPPLVHYLREILAAKGVVEREGDTERFPFPDLYRRRVEILYWGSWSASAALLLTAGFASMSTAARATLFVIAMIAGFMARVLSRVERQFRTIIEVTPFRVSEIGFDGSRRTVLFNRYLELHNEPKYQRMRLSPGNAAMGITLDYRRLGFERLAGLIVSYGRFRAEDQSAPSAAK
ncbi:MAG TPA: hypothetical protein VFT29_10815 [Gemmatimonadaceae bacterium]|nr:hypothetical protein [Gemmatimonadaceae bacterium]